MEFFDTILQFGSMAVSAFGGAIAISGLVDMSEGKSQQNAGKQQEGMTKLVGGGAIVSIGVLLVPQLSTLLTV
jgi:hypothetical protein